MYRQEFYIITKDSDKGPVAFRRMLQRKDRSEAGDDWTDNIFLAWHFPSVKVAKRTFSDFYDVGLELCTNKEYDYKIKKVIIDVDQTCICDSTYKEVALMRY